MPSRFPFAPGGRFAYAWQMGSTYGIRYPRRQSTRWFLRALTGRAVHMLGRLTVEGLEHVPAKGPVILAANHFSFADPALLLYACPRQVEFIGGAERPNSPLWSRLIPKAWGFIRAYRGGFSRSTLQQSLSVLEQDGVLGVFPEGGSWAALLRPARPGTAFLALHSGVPVVPVSITGAQSLLAAGKGHATIRFHPAIAAPEILCGGRAKRAALDVYGDQIMSVIAGGLPDDIRGKFSTCPDARAAAELVSAFPFDAPEMRGM